MTASSALAIFAGLVLGAIIVATTAQIATGRHRPEAGANGAEARVPADKRIIFVAPLLN